MAAACEKRFAGLRCVSRQVSVFRVVRAVVYSDLQSHNLECQDMPAKSEGNMR